jgi:hypothetical protein
MKTKALTIGEALKSINFLATNFMETNELDKEALEITNKSISKNLSVRDYFMGMPKDFGLDFMISLCKKMINEVEPAELLDLYAVCSAFIYESGDSDEAFSYLTKAQELNPEHALTKLLVRVYEAGWDNKSFSEMRDSIHAKVILELKENANIRI